MATTVKTPPTTLAHTGKSRFKSFEVLIPFRREKFRQLSRARLAPLPERMGVRCTHYDYAQLTKFIADPLNYRAQSYVNTTNNVTVEQKGGAQ